MNWTEVQIFTASGGVDMLCAMMLDLGIKGFTISDPEDFQAFLADKEGRWDYIDDDLMQLANAETSVIVYLPENAQGAEQLIALRDLLHHLQEDDATGVFGRLELTLNNVSEEDWANNWKQYFKPMPVGGRLLIKPSWEECPPSNDRIILEIDPASSFGTGQHHTTRLCLELLEDALQPKDRILDLGCGSGILSIAAMLLGAAEAKAVDIEENAVKTAAENAEKNHIPADCYHAYCGDVISDPALRETLGKGYDIITANIVADVLIGMSDLFRQFLRPGGTLIVSGIIMERKDEVLDVLQDSGYTLSEVREKEGWAAAKLMLK